MSRVLVRPVGELVIPSGVTDLASFREWVHSGELPEKLAVHFIANEVWVDLTTDTLPENAIKTAIYFTLGGLIRTEKLGFLFSNGVLLTNDRADMGCEPDATFASAESLNTRHVTFTAGATTGAVATEMVGSPDLMVEVVSPSSVDKDTVRLFDAYFQAGVLEYWLIDARDEADIRFDIYRRGTKGFTAVRKAKGWVRSDVFARKFRLTRESSSVSPTSTWKWGEAESRHYGPSSSTTPPTWMIGFPSVAFFTPGSMTAMSHRPHGPLPASFCSQFPPLCFRSVVSVMPTVLPTAPRRVSRKACSEWLCVNRMTVFGRVWLSRMSWFTSLLRIAVRSLRPV